MALRRRHSDSKTPILVPDSLLQEIQKTLHQTFASRLKAADRFHVFAEIYPSELVLAVGLQLDGSIRWTSTFASIDHKFGDQQEVTPKIYAMVDFVGDFFSTYFENNREFDWDDEWSAYERNGLHFFIRVNRDNIELDRQCRSILGNEDEET